MSVSGRQTQYATMLSFGTEQSVALGRASQHLGWIEVIAGRQTKPSRLFTHSMNPCTSFVIYCAYVQLLVDRLMAISAVLISSYTNVTAASEVVNAFLLCESCSSVCLLVKKIHLDFKARLGS